MTRQLPLFRDRRISSPYVKYPPVAFSFFVIVVSAAGYLGGTLELSTVAAWFAYSAFAVGIWLLWLIEPNPPFDRLVGAIFFSYALGLLLLGIPSLSIVESGIYRRAVAVVALGFVIPLMWLLYVELATVVERSEP